MIFLGNKIDEQTDFAELRRQQVAKAFFWSNQDHQDDVNIPMLTIVDSVTNEATHETLLFAQMNHCDTPYYALIKDNRLVITYEETGWNKAQVDRPRLNGELLEGPETKGACLGFAILTTKMAGAPEKILAKLFEQEEEYFYPPLIFMLDLEG